MRAVILGLDGAGKTSILSAMRGITLSGPPISTIGFNVESLEYENLVFTLWDVGGQNKFRPLWKHYYHKTQAVIFVVDASDRSRFEEAQNELSKIVNEKELKDALFLIYANKQVAKFKHSFFFINKMYTIMGKFFIYYFYFPIFYIFLGFTRMCKRRRTYRYFMLTKTLLWKSLAYSRIVCNYKYWWCYTRS